jgi:hypothetical protein
VVLCGHIVEETMPKTEVKSDPLTPLQRRIEVLIQEHGGLRKAARERGIDSGYLWRVRRGRVKTVGPKTLEKLGLRRTEKLITI